MNGIYIIVKAAMICTENNKYYRNRPIYIKVIYMYTLIIITFYFEQNLSCRIVSSQCYLDIGRGGSEQYYLLSPLIKVIKLLTTKSQLP